MHTPSKRNPWLFYSAVAIGSALFYYAFPALPQNESYHQFSGDYQYFHIENFFNVFSNILFLIAGLFGVYRLNNQKTFVPIWRWYFFFIGVFFVGIGSSYYHLNPTTKTLFWDRLPMALSFAALTANFLEERYHKLRDPQFFWILQGFSLFSIFYWSISENLGVGDLRLYGFVQFATIFCIITILIVNPHIKLDKPYWVLFIGYSLAKICESLDPIIFSLSNEFIGGHILKHLIAGGALLFFQPVKN